MPTNFNNPTIASLYADLITELKDRDTSIATMFRAGTETNVPTTSIRWSTSNRRFEEFDGVNWVDLEANYNISADRLGGASASSFMSLTSSQTKTAGILTLSVNSTTPLVIKSGTANAVHLPFYANSANQAERTGYIGNGAAGTDHMYFVADRPNANLYLNTNGTSSVGSGVVSINSRIMFDRGHGSVATGSDMLMTSDGLIASQGSMYLNIDSANNAIGSNFYWGHTTETSSATNLMKLADNGDLTLTSGLMTINSPTTGSVQALALNARNSSNALGFRNSGTTKYTMGTNLSEDFNIYSAVRGQSVLRIKGIAGNATYLYTNNLLLGNYSGQTASTEMNFWDANSASYRGLLWNNTNNQFEIENNSGVNYKILTSEDRNFKPVMWTTGGTSGTNNSWARVADVVITAISDELMVTFEVTSNGHNSYSRVNAKFRGNSGSVAVSTGVHVIYTSGSQAVVYDGDFKIMETSLGVYELWFRIGVDYSNISITEINKRSSPNTSITWAGSQTLQPSEPLPAGTLATYYATRGLEQSNSKTPSLFGYVVGGKAFSRIPTIASDGGMEVGTYLDFHPVAYAGGDFATRIGLTANRLNMVSSTAAKMQQNGYDLLDNNGSQDTYGQTRIGTASATHTAYMRFYSQSAIGKYSDIKCTNGNFHIDSPVGNNIYLNYYKGNHVYFGKGTGASHSIFNTSGALYPSANGTGQIGLASNRFSTINGMKGNFADDITVGSHIISETSATTLRIMSNDLNTSILTLSTSDGIARGSLFGNTSGSVGLRDNAGSNKYYTDQTSHNWIIGGAIRLQLLTNTLYLNNKRVLVSQNNILFSRIVGSNGSILAGSTDITVVRNSVGQYTITHPFNTLDVIGIANSVQNYVSLQVLPINTTSIRVFIHSTDTLSPTDSDFTLMLTPY